VSPASVFCTHICVVKKVLYGGFAGSFRGLPSALSGAGYRFPRFRVRYFQEGFVQVYEEVL
jgi:hypothetical protein